jgi:4-aminobutyrate aminotransferase-like enzyme
VSLARPIAAQVATIALEHGIVLNNIGTDILRFLPPLLCGKPEIDTLLITLSDILEGLDT